MNDVNKVSNLRPNPNMVDPDVKVPAAVRRAAEAAEAAQRAAYPDQAPPATPPSPPANPDGITIAPPSAVVTPPAPPAAVTPDAPTPPVTPPGNEPPVVGSAEDWQQKFRSAEGRRIKLENQLAQSNDRMAALEGMVEELQRNQSAPAPAPPTPMQRLVTEQEETEFGPEMLDVMGRRAKETISPELAELRAMMTSLTQKVEGTSTAIVRNARNDMLKSLDTQMPEWRQVNTNDGFKAWLALRDPLFGASRQSALLKAYEQNDTERVLNFFKSFISELAATTPADTIDISPAPPPARQSLEELAAPGRARTSAQNTAPGEKQIITTADIDAFYAAVRQGKYAGREAEKAALEQELFAAQREGRVRAA